MLQLYNIILNIVVAKLCTLAVNEYKYPKRLGLRNHCYRLSVSLHRLGPATLHHVNTVRSCRNASCPHAVLIISEWVCRGVDYDGNADESVAELRTPELVCRIAGSFYGLNCRRRRSRKASHAFSRVSAFRPPKANRHQNALFAAIKRQKLASAATDAHGMPVVMACVPAGRSSACQMRI